MKDWEIIADNLGREGWSWGCVQVCTVLLPIIASARYALPGFHGLGASASFESQCSKDRTRRELGSQLPVKSTEAYKATGRF